MQAIAIASDKVVKKIGWNDAYIGSRYKTIIACVRPFDGRLGQA